MAAQAAEQRAKRAAAAAYDYERDPRWSEFWNNNVILPPNMASRPDVVDHYKRKFYQRFIDPGLVVEGMTSRPTPGSTSGSTSESSMPHSSGASGGPSTQSYRDNNQLRMQLQAIHFALNAWVLAVAVLGIVPILTVHLSRKVYRLSLLGTIVSSLYSLYSVYGKPSVWTLAAIQTWLQSIIVTKDFIHLMFCLILITSQAHFRIALIPVLCWSVDHVSRFLRHNFTRSSLYRRYLEQPCIFVETNNTMLSILSSHAEVALGFLLIISLLSWQRSLVQTLVYWNLLKLMYHAPVTSGFHRNLWSNIGRLINPYINQHAPFFNTPIAAVQRWWFR
ncbi:dihydroflavonol 4-reductase/flavanone protein [Rhynchospora pubera]|uniref:Dihydroflavonol 4-reductase/flavanone protein n=1 Tax=Rhynchospora pubera TaxID=906938 RepID=A0AAV8DQ28_9POAL|nr:dihydroflavonol 4-reductase/flavanone protein [Rhynchospora pubera]